MQGKTMLCVEISAIFPMAVASSLFFPPSTPIIYNPTTSLSSFIASLSFPNSNSRVRSHSQRYSYRIGTHHQHIEEEEEEEEEEESFSFDEAVSLFNKREYYKCHDVLEAIWNRSQEPARTLIHAILQTAVGFHHLFNQNHKGAMMELGEGVCKLRKMNLETGPFHQFEKDISALLEFIYQTQLERAACMEDYCIDLDGSERSYQLLDGFAAGEHIYHLEIDNRWNAHIVFCPDRYHGTGIEPPSIQIPVLEASEQHMSEFEHQ